MNWQDLTPRERDALVAEIKRRYLELRHSGERIAREIHISRHTVYRVLGGLGITRSNSEAHIGLQAREDNPNWRGGKYTDSQGYVLVRVGTNTVHREHRLVAEGALGRKLEPGEIVHHVNGDRTDNRPENLEVLPSQSEHMKIHMTTEGARSRALRAVGVQV